MSINDYLTQFLGPSRNQKSASQSGSQLPSSPWGGIASGVAAGGIAALLIGNKKARNIAGKAATIGGAALLGGLAFSAYKKWQQGSVTTQPQVQSSAQQLSELSFQSAASDNEDFQVTLIKAMISAAKADGHIDGSEQDRIFNAIDKMELTASMKAAMFDWLRHPIPVQELVFNHHSLEQKSEIYLISCFAIDTEQNPERAHLQQLESSLQLPAGLAQQLELQAQQVA